MTTFDWTVIGAGPAGIAAVGKLIDQGIAPEKIGWMDPHFCVGDLGEKWSQVPSNTSVGLFLDYIYASKAFEFKERPEKFKLEDLPAKDTCMLEVAVKPLQWITEQLKTKVGIIQDFAIALNYLHGKWEIKTEQQTICSKNVILATGSEPKNLPNAKPDVIPLEIALNPKKLNQYVKADDVIGVFGSSHSAILVLAFLNEIAPKKIINFYRSPSRYAVYLDNWILYDDTGLKGFTAEWSKEHLEKKIPDRLQRVLVTDHIFEESLALCNKVVYAVGFERRKPPVLEQFDHLKYDDSTGIIAPGLFGVGIAFPQAKFNPLGKIEYRVGLWKFIDYLESILPIWIKYGN